MNQFLTSIETTSVDDIKIGDVFPNVFGQMQPITKILSRGVDYKGRKYVSVYQKFGSDAEMTNTIYEQSNNNNQ